MITKVKLLKIICLLFIYSLPIFSQVSTAPYIKVISPNGGEKWEANSTQTITWQSNNIANVKIEYSLSGGMGWHTVAPLVDASLGQYSWTVPNVQIAEVLIRISDAYNPLIFDISDNLFSILINATTNKSINKQGSVQSGTPIKIMPLGDSITKGESDDPNYVGYRAELWHLLYTAGYNFTFLGTQMSGTSSYGEGFDNHHEGHGGMDVGQPSYLGAGSTMLDNIDSYLSSNLPDIVLFHMGTNDINHDDDPSQISIQLYEVCTDYILVGNPNAEIFLAKIIANYYSYPTYFDATTTLNTAIGNDYNNTSILPVAQKKNIQLVNMQSSPELIYPTDFSSIGGGSAVLHPKPSGYLKMAQHWFNVMQAYYQPTLAGPANNATDQAIDVSLSWIEPQAVTDNNALTYELQIATDINFTNIVDNPTISYPSTSINASNLKYGATYYWRVRIENYGWSDVRNFTTEPMQVFTQVFLQGPFIPGSNPGAMTTTINSILPTTDPYSQNESGSIPSISIVDWILVQLRTATTPGNPSTATNVVAQRAAFLKSDGTVVDLDGISPVNFIGISSGNYFIVIKHRNHLAVMSASEVALPNSLAYNFTTGSDKYHGTTNACVDLSGIGTGPWAMIAGDANGSTVINATDYLFVKSQSGSNEYKNEDCNLSGIVNATDYLVIKPNSGKSSQAP